VGRRVAAKAQRLFDDVNAGRLTPARYLREFRALQDLGPAVAVYREDAGS
jgi:hypothetical protein